MKITKAEMREAHVESKAVKGRVYFFPQGENIVENLQLRHSRPYDEYRKLLPAVFKKVGFEASVAKDMASTAKWSQKAGCGCGCSPGFIVPALTGGEEVFVDIKE